MPFRFLPDMTRADLAFEAWADSPEGLICSASQALLAAMVNEPGLLRPSIEREIRVSGTDWEMLLYRALEEILYARDVEGLLVYYRRAQASRTDQEVKAVLRAVGEPIAAFRGEFRTEIKAVTFHGLKMERGADGLWRALVVVDV